MTEMQTSIKCGLWRFPTLMHQLVSVTFELTSSFCFDMWIENCDVLVLWKLRVSIKVRKLQARVCVSVLAVLLTGKNFWFDGHCRFRHLKTKIWYICTAEIKPTCIRKIVFKDWIACITLWMTSVAFVYKLRSYKLGYTSVCWLYYL